MAGVAWRIVLIGHNLQRVTDTGWHMQRQAIHVNVMPVSC